MSEDNVYTMPSLLERLATQIKRDIEQRDSSVDEWNNATYNLCVHLTQARGEHLSDIEFGQWCSNNGLGKDVINHQDRAAAIKMGEEPEALYKCLEVTTRRSLQRICKSEFGRFTRASKPASKPSKPTKPVKKTVSDNGSMFVNGKQIAGCEGGLGEATPAAAKARKALLDNPTASNAAIRRDSGIGLGVIARERRLMVRQKHIPKIKARTRAIKPHVAAGKLCEFSGMISDSIRLITEDPGWPFLLNPTGEREQTQQLIFLANLERMQKHLAERIAAFPEDIIEKSRNPWFSMIR